jgi:hypothetical protein
LWSEFQKVKPGIANLIRNPEAKAECPTVLRTYAPWEMVKGTKSSCLCLNCEGMNACRRGSKATIKAIAEVKNNVSKILPSAGGEEATPDDAVVDGADENIAELVAGILDPVTSDTVFVTPAVIAALTPTGTAVAATIATAAPAVAIALAIAATTTTAPSVAITAATPAATVNAAAAAANDAAVIATATDVEALVVALESETDTASNAQMDAAVAVKIVRLHPVMETKTKYDACVACLPCLNGGLLEDANIRCVNGTCPLCGFDKIWSKGLRRRIMCREWNPVKSEWVDKLNPNSVLATDSWMSEVQWRGYESKDKPSVGANLQALNRQAASAARAPDADNNDYSPTSESKSARNLSLETYRGTVVDYLDYMEKQIQFHIAHRNLVSSDHRCKTDYERNSRPWSVARDQDFS